MRRYMKADLRRVFLRIPRLILIALYMILVCRFSFDRTFTTLKDAAESMKFTFHIMVLGIVEIIFLYGDDFKAKTMQIAIGTGLPRQKVVHAKLLDFMIIALADMTVVAVVQLLTCLYCVSLYGNLNYDFSLGSYPILFFMSWFTMVAYLGTIMFVMFWAQGTALTMMLYIIMSSKLIDIGLSSLGDMLKLTKYHIQTYCLSGMLDNLYSHLIIGQISWTSLIGILVHMMIGFALSSIIFKKLELEF